jgi:hypothetical protein
MPEGPTKDTAERVRAASVHAGPAVSYAVVRAFHPMMLIMSLITAVAITGASIHGTVRAEGTLEAVPFARIDLPRLDRSTTADERGRFVLRAVPAGEWRLEVRALGYATTAHTVYVPLDGLIEVEVRLAAEPIAMAPVTARALRSAPHAGGVGEGAGPTPIRMDLAAIEASPGLFQSDVFRALHSLPSIAALSDFSTGLYVRGGASDQTLVTLDGVPLFNPYRMGGLFSVLDPGILSHVEIVPGGASAALGDRLGGIIAVRTRDGSADRLHGWGEVSMISTRAGFDGPAGSGRFLVAGRTNYLGALASPFIEGFGYGATDLYLRVTQPVADRTEVVVSGFADSESLHHYNEIDGVRTRWASALGSVSVYHATADDVHGHVRIAWSSFTGGLREEAESAGEMDTWISDLLLAAGASAVRGAHTLTVGAQVDAYRFRHSIRSPLSGEMNPWSPETHPFSSFEHRSRPTSLALWVEDDWQPLPSLRLRGGVRALHAPGIGTEVMPRAGATWRPRPALALSVAGGRYAQVHYGSRDDEALYANLLSFDLPVAVEASAGASRSSDAVAGIEWSRGGTHARVDAYRRWIHRLPARPLDRRQPQPLLSEATVEGSAVAEGLELSLANGWRHGSLAVSYTLARVEYRSEGESYPPRYDRRHTGQLTGELTPSQRTQWSARVVAASGQPFTPVIGVIHPIRADHAWRRLRPMGFAPAILGDHNSARMPGYFRVDLSVRRQVTREWFGRPVTLTPYAQVLNVLNTHNPLLDAPRTGDPNPSVARLPQLPILPTVGVTWRF